MSIDENEGTNIIAAETNNSSLDDNKDYADISIKDDENKEVGVTRFIFLAD